MPNAHHIGRRQINCPACNQTIDVPKPGANFRRQPVGSGKSRTPIIIGRGALFVIVAARDYFCCCNHTAHPPAWVCVLEGRKATPQTASAAQWHFDE